MKYFALKFDFYDAVCVYGQIFSSDDGKLDATSIMLQGSRNISNGKTVHFDLNNLAAFSLFPGQVIYYYCLTKFYLFIYLIIIT